ncbi:MAG: ATP-binding cassette domain-containing protein [Rhodobacter sp.]|nr:ATP-binding cassette domain-containing protein [Paracoccaceae bacterium]MCC0077296.1 ATP-binding cassette domain-containing protein [Rhodobacter sp.]
MLDSAAEPVLSLRDVEVSFPIRRGFFAKPGRLHAVNKVSLDVQRGEFISIVGESGCGKSTLAKTLLGLQPATAGTIRINGRDLADYSRKELAHQVQPIFQDPYSSLNPRKSVAANIALPLILSESLPASEIRDRVREIMQMVSLPQRFEHSYPGQMSGGQRQRVAIARALITRPRILVCDEPTSALDVSVQAQILNLLKDLSRRLNLTSIFISHDLSVVRHLTQRVAVMYLGRVVELGASEEIFNAPRHPYTQLLIRSILPPDPAHRLPPVAWDGGGPDPTNPPRGCHFNPRCRYATDLCRTELPPLAGGVACHAWHDPDAWRAAGGQIPQL